MNVKQIKLISLGIVSLGWMGCSGLKKYTKEEMQMAYMLGVMETEQACKDEFKRYNKFLFGDIVEGKSKVPKKPLKELKPLKVKPSNELK